MAESPPESAGSKPPGGGHAEPAGAHVSRVTSRPGETVRVIAPPVAPAEPPPPADVALPPHIVTLQSVFPDAVDGVVWWVGDWSVVIATARLIEVGGYLRDAPEAEF